MILLPLLISLGINTAIQNYYAASYTTHRCIEIPTPARIQVANNQHIAEDQEYKIQVALLLDVSSSMDGLIEQAKSQLWKMVNELATSKKNGKAPHIELALYDYGKSSHPAGEGYIRQVTPFTTDLDLVSQKLFELNTNGGDEYCGWVIDDAVEKLNWSKSNDDLKIIIIAGNEPFTQGKIDYKDACKKSIARGIVVNTIFCGNCDEGVRTQWKDGADRADGKYLCINQNATVQHIATPFDDEIGKLNDKLNTTYIGYGSAGRARKEMQVQQDANAAQYGAANKAERAMSKSSKAYNNSSWDLVDNYKDKGEKALEIREEEMPEEMKKMSEKERKEFVETKSKERAEVQNQIRELNDKRNTFIAEERKKQSNNTDNTLDKAMLDAVREQATNKQFKFDK